MVKEFASEYARTDEGWIKFPADSEYRKRMFPPEVSDHQAKANVYLIQSIIEYVSEPNQIILDPMSGTGTLMVGALIGRTVICVEISAHFHLIQQQAVRIMEKVAPGIGDHIMLINLPCQHYLPIPDLADHIIFSPPYASIMKKGKKLDKMSADVLGDRAWEYSESPLNLGVMNDFIWAQEMEGIYRKCYETLKPGGTMSIIVKDHMKDRKRVELSKAARDACLRAGFIELDWFKWSAPGSAFTGIYRARGWEVVDDEDIIILQKGGLQWETKTDSMQMEKVGLRPLLASV
ncbi:hypothetical protein LCGC14_0947360 [marine sediment metagenome]|uniref:DNA methylase N-4/N-6 domain-containing protein n=1 Tax=marine sediment metagenome TaxID=412755 RepID=A0A0F9R1X6_9ZZZZ